MAKKQKKSQQGSVRIIGGEWRGRKLPVPDLPGLRPSGDRCRETLFNWLQPHIRGARCADLFAGTGVLGLEAASRGAASVLLIENSRPAAAAIRDSIAMLGVGPGKRVELLETDALHWLSGSSEDSLDIVFIDPPFGLGLEQSSLALLAGNGSVVKGGLVYVEMAREEALLNPGSAWEIEREKVLGDVRMLLLKKI